MLDFIELLCNLLHLMAWVGALPLGDWIRGIRASSQSNMPIKGNICEGKPLTFICKTQNGMGLN